MDVIDSAPSLTYVGEPEPRKEHPMILAPWFPGLIG